MDVGILRALGFDNSSVTSLMLIQALIMTIAGGLAGMGLAMLASPLIAKLLGTSFPGYEVGNDSLVLALCLTVGLGVVAGVVPLFTFRSLEIVDALRAKA